MKKIIAASLAFAMVFGLSACGSNINDEYERVQRASMEAARERTTNEITSVEQNYIVIDPFKDVKYETDGIYPEDFKITFDASNSPLGGVATYTYFIDSADEEKIVVLSRANIDTDDVQKYLEENNFKVENNETSFEINVSDLKKNLISADDLDKTSITKLKAEMLDFLKTENETDQSPNPDYTIEKLYLIVPNNVEYNISTQKDESSIHRYQDNSSFEDKEIIKNEATVRIDSSTASMGHYFLVGSSNKIGHGGLGIFKDNNGAYYGVFIDGIILESNQLSDLSFRLSTTGYSSNRWNYEFESASDVYDDYFNIWELDESKYSIIDITLN